MMNKKLKKLLKRSKGSKTVYGISKKLGVSPQAGDYIVKKKDLAKDFIRLKKIADYMEVSIEEILDLETRKKERKQEEKKNS